MSLRWLLAVLALVVALPAVATAQKLVPPPKKTAEAAKPGARVAVTFDALHLAPAELPKGWSLTNDLADTSDAVKALAEGLYDEATAKPARRDAQVIATPDGKGALVCCEFAGVLPDEVRDDLPPLVLGEAARTAGLHADFLVRSGSTLLLVSAPLGSEVRRFLVDRLRGRFGLRVYSERTDHQERFEAVLAALKENDAEKGLALLVAEEKELAADSYAAYLEGECFKQQQDWEAAARAYGRAVALDATSDPLPDDWGGFSAKEGLGFALYSVKRYAEAIRPLDEAAAIATDLRVMNSVSGCLYQSACCSALAGKGDAALTTLAEAIRLDAKNKAQARDDADFTALRKRPEFQKLVK